MKALYFPFPVFDAANLENRIDLFFDSLRQRKYYPPFMTKADQDQSDVNSKDQSRNHRQKISFPKMVNDSNKKIRIKCTFTLPV